MDKIEYIFAPKSDDKEVLVAVLDDAVGYLSDIEIELERFSNESMEMDGVITDITRLRERIEEALTSLDVEL